MLDSLAVVNRNLLALTTQLPYELPYTRKAMAAMASYDGIEFLVFRLKNSMIDLYMTDLGFIIDGAYYYDRGAKVQRPGFLGAGGGTVHSLGSAPLITSPTGQSFVDEFEHIRDEIDLALPG